MRDFPTDFPRVMHIADVAEVLGVSVSRAYRLDRIGKLLFAEIRPRIGRKAWDRDRLAAYVTGELRGLLSVSRRAS